MPLATIDPNYSTQTQRLRDIARRISRANTESDQRLWQNPDTGLGGDITIPGLQRAYNRLGLGDQYARVHSDPEGTTGDAMSVKLQSDYLATQERAYRLRRLGPVRACMHAACRRFAHSLTIGIFGRVDAYAQDLIVAGASGFVPPQ